MEEGNTTYPLHLKNGRIVLAKLYYVWEVVIKNQIVKLGTFPQLRQTPIPPHYGTFYWVPPQ